MCDAVHFRHLQSIGNLQTSIQNTLQTCILTAYTFSAALPEDHASDGGCEDGLAPLLVVSHHFVK